MKLLFDHNLSPRLVSRLADIYPESSHLYFLGLDQAKDGNVWQYARDHERDALQRFFDLWEEFQNSDRLLIDTHNY